MYGTLRGALAARKISINSDKYKATVEGRIESVGHTIRITEIAVNYQFAIAGEKRAEAERAVQLHAQGCPAYLSVKDAIKITWTADITEEA